eukprot:TRINITY_DN3755_c0_g2_i1.p1 TRINITY_DN3755_c0_g2~~TRINITY_DN3755_c0_g2_i1.p1  ORF type:complete len:218 (-),score=22.64 TRINITY_DN3755_c0_g2_i1:133-786(-)
MKRKLNMFQNEQNSNDINSLLLYAIQSNDLKLTKLLFCQYYDKININQNLTNGDSFLHNAIQCRTKDVKIKLQIILYLIFKGINLNLTNYEGKTALHIATEQNDCSIVSILLRFGAFLNVQNHEDGNTPLHCAIKNNNYELTAMLLKSGASVNIVNYENENALDLIMKCTDSKMKRLVMGCPNNPGNSMCFENEGYEEDEDDEEGSKMEVEETLWWM